MSAITRPGLAPTSMAPAPAPMAPAPATVGGPVTQVRVVRAEWTKLLALRSTRWCGLTAVVLIVGLGAAIAGSGTAYHVSAGNTAAKGVSASLLGLLFAQLVIGVVGVLVRTPETVRLGQLLAAPGITVINDGTDLLRVSGTTAEQIGIAAWRAHLPVY